jgi:uncharacterized membrane protein
VGDKTYFRTLAVLFAALGTSAAAFALMAPSVSLDLSTLLPAGLSLRSEAVPSLAAAFALPVLALLLWVLLHDAPVSALGRLGARLMRIAPTDRERYLVFAPAYRLVVIGVLTIILAFHAAVLSAVTGWPAAPGRVAGLLLAAALVIIGNVMPQLRPNSVAGVRTARTLRDPVEWARVHRALGVAWVLAGVATAGVALVAPRYALVTWVAAMLVALVGGATAPRGLTRARP